MLRNRKGVTLTEIMAVVAMTILMTAFAFPKLKETRRAASMQSARTQVESYLTVARSIAIRNGVRAVLIREGNTIRIMADSGNTLVLVVRPVQLDSVSHVRLEATADTIVYDNRGNAVNLDGSGEKFYITSMIDATSKDSVCVTRFGLVLDRRCGLAVAAKKELPKDSSGTPPLDEDIDPPSDGTIPGPIPYTK